MSQWFILADGETQGPFPEQHIRDGLSEGTICDPMQVRVGTGTWTDASVVQQRFDNLSKNGWFLDTGYEILGPLTDERLMELVSQGDVLPDTRIRRGEDGKWSYAIRVKGLF